LGPESPLNERQIMEDHRKQGEKIQEKTKKIKTLNPPKKTTKNKQDKNKIFKR
jgi:hypothetical protein